MRSRPAEPAFSAIEMVLVVAILGIITVIAAPHLTQTTTRARDVAMAASLAQLQRAVDLYTAEHADLNPVTDPDGATTSTGSSVVFRLTRYTDDAGNVAPAGLFGPYLRSWPTNLYNGKQSLRVDGPVAGANTDGWRIDSASLKIEADQDPGVSQVGHAAGSGGIDASAIGP